MNKNMSGRLLLVCFSFFLFTSFKGSASPREIRVKFEVNLPRHFSGASEVFIAGDVPALGDWEPKGLPLKHEDKRFSATVSLPAETAIAYKVNLGDWFHSEVSSEGKELPNRKLKCSSDCVITINVENIRLHAFHAVPKTVSPNINYHFDFYSSDFDNYRHLAVYVPESYYHSPARRYSVIYALDGNNLFDEATAGFGSEWGLDETLNRMIARGEIPPVIVVGIYNTTKRPDEYLHCDDAHYKVTGQAEKYVNFITRQIKPFIDARYRTLPDRENTSLLGSSFGGEFALYSAWRHGDVFSKFVAMSPAFWFADYCMFNLLGSKFTEKPQRVWIDMGDREGWDDGAVEFKNGVSDLDQAYRLLLASGLSPKSEVVKMVAKGAIHHERSWGARVDKALRFLLKGE